MYKHKYELETNIFDILKITNKLKEIGIDFIYESVSNYNYNIMFNTEEDLILAKLTVFDKVK